ncbi:MAG: type I restriction enzyme HsdR N-terminal domain-containing protein [Veillonella sp.]|uniref:type I restriction enzyme HsdR N-terminal domain-containing protein n=1 Tax=Veillonella sp. TaxID=1926307 RepID=UPI00290B5771|nr:type I restriction enzyme HsdR N-terminal domain-containing protein [Veillonella sp.]MDU7715506.1 type I restriction enzyme HsdR N-terminal domain-containing protein [Veillonella sp.]
MKNIKKIFNAIKLNKYKPSSTSYFDPVRKYFVQKTPEEAIRQKTIKFLEEYLGIPLNRLRVEESMAHVKLRAKGRADIVVYRDDNKNHPLMVIECKAPEIDISCEEVREQAERYRNILKADYIMLINGVQIIIYKYDSNQYLELDDIPTYEDLLESKISFKKSIPLTSYNYEEVMSRQLQKKFEKIYLGCETPNQVKGFALNFLNLIMLKTIDSSSILENIGVFEDKGIGKTRFGNSAGYNYQLKTRLFIAKDNRKKDQILGISLYGNYNTQLNVSITNSERRHHSLQLDMDKFCKYDYRTDKIVITHNGTLSTGRGGSISKFTVIDYIKNNAPELICDEEIHLGTLDNSRLLEWDYYDVQSFVKNLFQYAILRDEIRKKFKRKHFRTKK